MLSIIRGTLKFLTISERRSYFLLVAARGSISFLDLAGIFGIGYIATSIALFLTSGSDPNRLIYIAGISLPAVNINSLPVLVAIILFFFISKAIAAILLTRALGQRIAMVEARAAKEIARRLLGGDLKQAMSRSREEIIFAVQNGSPAAFNGVLNNLATLLAEGFLFVILILTFISVNPVAASILILYFGIIALAMHFLIGTRSQKASETISTKTMEANKLIADLQRAFRELTVSGKKDYFFEKIYQARQATAFSVGNQMYLAGLPRHLVETALLLGILVFGLFQSQNNNLVESATTIGIFLTGGLRIVAALLPLQNSAISLKETINPAKAALDVLDLEDNSQKIKHYSEKYFPISAVEVRLENVGVSFQGESKFQLGPVNLTVKAGSQVAIIGSSGAGKSTLADVIAGVQPASQGSSILQGMSAPEFVLSHPGVVAYVPQDPGIFGGTIRQNIAVGLSDDQIVAEDLNQAVAQANLVDFIHSLPLGLDTDIGVQADSISGGQLQRIALARALYLKPKLLILDEATSSLDAITENEIGLVLEGLRGRATVVIVAHRLNTVRNADEVILLQDGRVRDRGAFADLQKRVPELAKAVSLSTVEGN